MNTIEYKRLNLKEGETLLDMGIRPTVGFSASGELQRSTVEVGLNQ